VASRAPAKNSTVTFGPAASARPSTLAAGISGARGPLPSASRAPSVTLSRLLRAPVCQNVGVGRLLVIRHAQSIWNAAGRWQGWSDPPLSEFGAEQAWLAGQALAANGLTPSLMACSDLARARRTAELIALELGYEQPLVIDRDLREQDVGDWNGLTSEQIAARWPREYEARRAGELGAVPGGETGSDFIDRSVSAIYRLACRQADEAVVVAHAGVVVALELALGVWEGRRHSNLSGWWLEAQGDPPDLELVPVSRVDLLAHGAEEVEKTVTGYA
jgi:broad specificity phosphatase PhoE